MKQITQEWVSKAEGDFSSVQLLSSQPKPNFDLICFLSQQCVEKYLKACLQEADIFFPKTHLLPALLDLLLPIAPHLESIRPESSSLSTYAVEFRYPGSSATSKLATNALRDCINIRKTVRRHLKLDAETIKVEEAKE